MYKVTNKTPHPHDLQTKTGPKVISAYGTLEDDFDPAYLEIIKLGFDVEKVGAKAEVKAEVKDAPVVEPDAYDARAEYEELTGKKPDGRWSEDRVSDEVEKIKAA